MGWKTERLKECLLWDRKRSIEKRGLGKAITKWEFDDSRRSGTFEPGGYLLRESQTNFRKRLVTSSLPFRRGGNGMPRRKEKRGGFSSYKTCGQRN